MSSEIKVYQVNDIEWYAAVSREQAIEMLVECVGPEEAENQMENGTYPIELSSEAMERLIFRDDDGLFGEAGQRYTFAEALRHYQRIDTAVPFMFAFQG